MSRNLIALASETRAHGIQQTTPANLLMLMMDLVLNLTEVLDKHKVNTSKIPCLSLSDNDFPSAMIQIYSEFLKIEDSLYAPVIHRFMMKLHDRRVRM
jgi:hypothetical protein